jgi:hypothetical protein
MGLRISKFADLGVQGCRGVGVWGWRGVLGVEGCTRG